MIVHMGGDETEPEGLRLGARFVVLDIESAEGQGGYAKAMDEAYYKRQRELLTAVLREQDVVITTAAVPGRKAPVLITREMAEAMLPGSVIVDIAAERGGNCDGSCDRRSQVAGSGRQDYRGNAGIAAPQHSRWRRRTAEEVSAV